MPSFDVVSELDLQEVRNAIDQTAREVANRFDFKGTESTVELGDGIVTMESTTEDRLSALLVVLEEKMIRRKVSLKTLIWGQVEQAARGHVRKTSQLKAGINSDDARKINKLIKDLNLKGIQSQYQGNQVRVSGKKRDTLQEVINTLKEADLDLPLQFTNFRD